MATDVGGDAGEPAPTTTTTAESQKFVFRFGGGEDLSAMSQSPDAASQKIVVAGRSILRILSVDAGGDGRAGGFTSVQNLRTRRRSGLNYSVVDVVWNPADAELIATSATNGVIVLWKNFTPETETIMKDHSRSVNRLDWHPGHPHILLSASQDGTMRLWDTRGRVGSGIPSMVLEPRSDSARDARFSPFHTFYLCAGFDNGTMQLWDTRKPEKYFVKITAHNGPVTSLAWHRSNSDMVASGGRDRMLNVWNLKDSLYKPAHTIQAISSVATVSWRPNFPTQLLSTSSVLDGNIHVWNYRKPNVPYLVVGGHSDVVTALLHHPKSDDAALVSCSKDSTVQYHRLDAAVRPWSVLHSAAISWNVYNHVAVNNDIIDRRALYREFADADALQPATATPSSSSLSTANTTVTTGNTINSTHSVQNLSTTTSLSSSSIAAAVSSSASLSSMHAKPTPAVEVVDAPPRSSLTDIYLRAIRRGGDAEPRKSDAERQKAQQLQQQLQLAQQLQQQQQQLLQHRPISSKRLPPCHVAIMREIQPTADDESSFSPPVFLALARGYKSMPYRSRFVEPPADLPAYRNELQHAAAAMFAHNERLCSQLNRPRLALVWRLLSLMYLQLVVDSHMADIADLTSTLESNSTQQQQSSSSSSSSSASSSSSSSSASTIVADDVTDSESNAKVAPPKLSSIPPMLMQLRDDRSSDDSADDEHHHYDVDEEAPLSRDAGSGQQPPCSEAQTHRYAPVLNCAPLLDDLGMQSPFGTSLRGLLEHHADQGDIQTCCAVALALGPRLLPGVPVTQILRWFTSYLELLQRMQAWTSAARVIYNAPWEEIRTLSQGSTSMHIGCAHCKKVLMTYDQGHRCLKCRQVLTLCSICDRPVDGLFVWCQGCGHGGHLQHVRDWFSSHTLCPTGCNHECTFQLRTRSARK